jgi:hypothetical protein
MGDYFSRTQTCARRIREEIDQMQALWLDSGGEINVDKCKYTAGCYAGLIAHIRKHLIVIDIATNGGK